MKNVNPAVISILLLALLHSTVNAQNIFPANGRAGIYTTNPATSLQVRGGARIGTGVNYVNVDSTTGNFSFSGTAAYLVAGNKYAFQYTANPNYGLFFNATNSLYEFRTSNALPIFSIGANSGNGIFTGGVQVGNSTSNNAGNIRWTGTDFQGYTGSAWKSLTTGTAYSAGTGISIASNVITNSSPDKIVTITPALNMTVTGTYPNFGLSFITSPWYASGNAGTNPSTDFIGTTDARPLLFRVNNQKSGWLEHTGNNNTSFGYQGLIANTTGFYNTALGYNALKANLTGGRNTGVGAYALLENTADNNTAIGTYALESNTTGTENTGIGANALTSNISGIHNTATGFAALNSNTASNNTATGAYALYLNSTGANNTGHGYEALYQNTTGSNNTANGLGALTFNSTGNNNTAHGYNALYTNTTGGNNTATGVTALFSNTIGTGNTATGLEALFFNTTGNYNAAHGLDALLSNTTGSNNTASGYQSLLNNLAGSYNTASGSNALAANSQGSYNTALGADALASANVVNNTAVGYRSLNQNQSGNDNTAVGYYAMFLSKGGQNTAIGSSALQGGPLLGIGNGSTAVGYQALKTNNGNYNTAAGYNALLVNQTGNNNTALGTNALFSVTSGSDNTGVGYGADADATVNNSIIIGKNVRATSSNVAIIGNASTTFLYGPVYIITSDGRFKKDIKENVPGLDFINALRPVAYKYKSYELQKFLLQNDQKKLAELKQSDFTDAESKTHLGFIAQEVEKTMKENGFGTGIVKDPVTKDDSYGIAYNELIPPLVKSVQQLSHQNDSLRSANEKQQKELNKIATLLNSLQQQVNDLQLKQQDCCSNTAINPNTQTQSSTVLGNHASLEQNIPNPFANATIINYTLPQTNVAAQIIIRDKTGKALKSINVSGNGKGSLKVDATTLASGAYSYSLIVNGRLISTKQMVLAK